MLIERHEERDESLEELKEKLREVEEENRQLQERIDRLEEKICQKVNPFPTTPYIIPTPTPYQPSPGRTGPVPDNFWMWWPSYCSSNSGSDLSSLPYPSSLTISHLPGGVFISVGEEVTFQWQSNG